MRLNEADSPLLLGWFRGLLLRRTEALGRGCYDPMPAAIGWFEFERTAVCHGESAGTGKPPHDGVRVNGVLHEELGDHSLHAAAEHVSEHFFGQAAGDSGQLVAQHPFISEGVAKALPLGLMGRGPSCVRQRPMAS